MALFDEALAEHIPDQVVEYKTVGETGLNLHIFHPEDPSDIRHAAILWLHGGGWKAGNAEQLFPHAAYYAKLGYVGISADYRLAGNGQTIFDCIEDVRDAYYWIYQNAASLGIDPQRIIVGGESAGGHLAGCIGYIADDRLTGIPDPQPYPAACILVNPIVDMTSISWAMTVPGLAPGEIALAESISPLFHVDPLDPPALLLHGLADTVVPPAQSTDFATALQSVGQVAKLRLWEGKGHAFFLYLPEYSLIDKPVIQLSLLQTEAFLQAEGLNGFPVVDGHFAPVHLFAGPDGFRSFSELVSAGGLLYGSTYAGGADNAGTLFMYDPATHAHTVLREFAGPDGREVFNGLAIVGDVIFGVGKFGGDFNRGTLFSVSTDGTGFQVLHYFG
ncbi:MAG TPA: alpha/beta hydrolase fold domain-containing protein, partial [Oceanipulchritudo sp.]|nr:alpha/beta hydrolase fold domain-containing protein [Oceanipulchritudo sp.]